MHSRLLERTSTEQARIQSSDTLETFRLAEGCLKHFPILFPSTLSTLSSSCILCIFAKASGGSDILQDVSCCRTVMLTMPQGGRFDPESSCQSLVLPVGTICGGEFRKMYGLYIWGQICNPGTLRKATPITRETLNHT